MGEWEERYGEGSKEERRETFALECKQVLSGERGGSLGLLPL